MYTYVISCAYITTIAPHIRAEVHAQTVQTQTRTRSALFAIPPVFIRNNVYLHHHNGPKYIYRSHAQTSQT